MGESQEKVERIGKKLSSHGYRNAMSKAHFNLRIRVQIRNMRMARGWTQAELAEKIGTKQSVISRLEGCHTDKPLNTDTLFRIAQVFDVAFFASFVDFPKFIRETRNMSPKKLTIKPFDFAATTPQGKEG
jgi:transcriptional regulator with XRE-family HTH domain